MYSQLLGTGIGDQYSWEWMDKWRSRSLGDGEGVGRQLCRRQWLWQLCWWQMIIATMKSYIQLNLWNRSKLCEPQIFFPFYAWNYLTSILESAKKHWSFSNAFPILPQVEYFKFSGIGFSLSCPPTIRGWINSLALMGWGSENYQIFDFVTTSLHPLLIINAVVLQNNQDVRCIIPFTVPPACASENCH